MLTLKQRNLLLFINDRLAAKGVAPSFDEMKEALGLKSKSGIHRLITALEERGFIRRLAHRARALEVLRLPDELVRTGLDSGSNANGFSPKIIRGDFNNGLQGRVPEQPDSSKTFQLPMLGKIAAGTPIEALQDQNQYIEIPGSMLGQGEHFALQVEGDSMIEAGILDGDMAVIQRCDLAENGTIVVALIDEHEATLKRLRKKGNTIALEPANKDFETRIFGPDRVRVQGRIVGLIRQY